ncbi:MAG TPA: heat-inducible transcriptional repressor HrcA [Candidatus Eisenbacteria bacterium]
MLSERDRLILSHIINQHVETAAPVGSQVLARGPAIGLSPASIRGIMMDLEERGYLGQPHTSAGRVPTDKAYRAWVDGWLEPTPLDEPELERIESAFEGTPAELSSLLEQAARLLGGACRQVGVALAPEIGHAVLAGIEFTRVAEGRVLMILRLRGNAVRTVLLDVSSRLESEALAATAARLNEYLAGLTLAEISATLVERSRSWPIRDEEIVTRLVALGPGLLNLGEPSALYVRGTGELAAQPEFQSPERLREILALIEERPGLSALLSERRARPGIEITIGRENPSGPLTRASIVTFTWSHGALSGTVGVIGPTRMPYPRVLALLSGIAGGIDRRLSA